MKTITENLAAALLRIRDRNPATYAHDTAEMRADDWQDAFDAIAEYEAHMAKPERYRPIKYGNGYAVTAGDELVCNVYLGRADMAVRIAQCLNWTECQHDKPWWLPGPVPVKKCCGKPYSVL